MRAISGQCIFFRIYLRLYLQLNIIIKVYNSNSRCFDEGIERFPADPHESKKFYKNFIRKSAWGEYFIGLNRYPDSYRDLR